MSFLTKASGDADGAGWRPATSQTESAYSSYASESSYGRSEAGGGGAAETRMGYGGQSYSPARERASMVVESRSEPLLPASSRGNSVFGDEAAAARSQSKALVQYTLDKMVDHLVERKSSLNLLFRQFDVDGSGRIDLDELYYGLRSVGLRLSIPEVKAVMQELDNDGNGEIDMDEFTTFFKNERAERWWCAAR